MSKAEIETILRESFKPTVLEVLDDSPRHAGHVGVRKTGGGHYLVRIVSDAFQGKSHLERHRLVYDSLHDLMKTKIHALALKAQTPQEALT